MHCQDPAAAIQKLWLLVASFFLCFRALRAPYSYYQITVSNDAPEYPPERYIESKSYMYKVFFDVCSDDGC